ncbi:zinc finger protein 131-like isoform X2 [Athalia rosae]|uniref:zinc finger protein 131-like isoform X2 n=1 Tax=Athalia rosae TaxID=37344 RepID=UPI0020347A4F|nr:zinc finger protein 131-like isoform X2 [Athalia rosae]
MEDNQQFNLRWNNHTNNIVQVFLEHLSSEQLVDVTLSCQGQFIKAHRMILSACSPYFQELFKNHKTKHPVIILNGIKYENLQMMIKFMYHGEVCVQEAQLDDLLAAAETLQVKGLSNVRNKYEKGKIQSQNNIDKTQTSNLKNNHNEHMTPGPHELNYSQTSEKIAEKNRPPPPDPPRVRKRRKMSHTVNELAKETVFTSNGAVCLEPEVPLIENEMEEAMIKIEPLDIKDNYEENDVDCPSSSEVKTLRIKGRGKSSQKTIVTTEKVQVASKIPRPPNAFMIFANEWRRKIAFQYPNENNKEISVRLGLMWKGLNIEAKEAYYASAKKADEDHKRKYPGYYYSPKEARLRKNLKQDLMLARCLPTNIRVLMNVDNRPGNMVLVSPKDEDAGNIEIDEPILSVKLNGKNRLADQEKNGISLTLSFHRQFHITNWFSRGMSTRRISIQPRPCTYVHTLLCG